MYSDSSNADLRVTRQGYLSFSKFCRYARNKRLEFLDGAEELILNESSVIGDIKNGALGNKHNLKEIHHLIETGRILVNKYDKKRWLYPSDKEESLDAIVDEARKRETTNQRQDDKEVALANVCEAAYGGSPEYEFRGV